MNALDTMIELLDQMSEEGLFRLDDPEAPKGYVVRDNGNVRYNMQCGSMGLFPREEWSCIYDGLQQIEPEDIPRILVSDECPFVNNLLLGTDSPSFKVLGYMTRSLTIRYLQRKLGQYEC